MATLSVEQVHAFAARPTFDATLAQAVLGFRPTVTLEAGMAGLRT
jgi:nucleoside-diphosphate-sugar epimerase